ncbi:MAG: hypothetical protein ACJA13_001503 [Paraglaciecola sp.]|jgi:hypothetical protein
MVWGHTIRPGVPGVIELGARVANEVQLNINPILRLALGKKQVR